MKNLPIYLSTLHFLNKITKKYKIEKIYSANNIDANLSIISELSRKKNIKHIVVQCTSKERIKLPNYCDCDQYICESGEYGSFLKRNLPIKTKNLAHITWPTPLFKSYKSSFEAIKKTFKI